MKVLLVSFKHPGLNSDEFQEGDVFVSASGFLTKGIISTFELFATKNAKSVHCYNFITHKQQNTVFLASTLCLEPEWCLRHGHAK